jgi:hypothetical protein
VHVYCTVSPVSSPHPVLLVVLVAGQPASERSRSGDPLEAEEGGARKKTKHGAPTFFSPKMPAQRRACVHGPLWRPFFEPQATLLINGIAVARAHVPRPYR